MDEKIVRHLRNLIRNATINYRNGFSWNDVKLSDEFKKAYSQYFSDVKRGFSIDFNDYSAVVTTSSNLQIFIPNQWFALAVYAKEVCRELLKYKAFFDLVSDELCEKPHDLALALRNGSDGRVIKRFSDALRRILTEEYGKSKDGIVIDDAVNHITKFVTDYDWWSGSKTVDRGDFYISVVLNMLSLVNVSQGYVADIAYAYCTYEGLDSVTDEIASFTVDLGDSTWVPFDDSHNLGYDHIENPQDSLLDTVQDTPRHNVIHISGSNRKEIRIKT